MRREKTKWVVMREWGAKLKASMKERKVGKRRGDDRWMADGENPKGRVAKGRMMAWGRMGRPKEEEPWGRLFNYSVRKEKKKKSCVCVVLLVYGVSLVSRVFGVGLILQCGVRAWFYLCMCLLRCCKGSIRNFVFLPLTPIVVAEALETGLCGCIPLSALVKYL